VILNLFSAADPSDDWTESCGPLKPVNTVTYTRSLLENAINSFARQYSLIMFHESYQVAN